MRFDDRLSTVLGLTAEAPRDRAVQWRQLVELVARGGGETDPALLARALERIAELRPALPDAVRASAARAIAGLPVPAGLLAIFAADRPEIVAPLLASAELDRAGWDKVRARASPEVRLLVDGISPPAREQPPTPQTQPPPLPSGVAQARGLFRWECGPSGEIDWVEGAPRAALVGLSLARELRGSFSARLPFADEPLVAAEAGVAAGPWLWSGVPRFAPESGRFTGYSGLARREGASLAIGAAAAAPPAASQLDADSLRELIHELRTPLTAIIGFGEIIEGQFLGPAHRAYRERAGEIVRQARRLLGAVEELDLAAKLGSSSGEQASSAPVEPLVRRIAKDVGQALSERGAAVRAEVRSDQGRYRMDEAMAERLLRRFTEAIAGVAEPGEAIDLIADRVGPHIALSLGRPRVTAGLSEDELFDLNPKVGAAEPLGLGFTLRLLRGLARIAGGELDVGAGRIVLLLPAAPAA